MMTSSNGNVFPVTGHLCRDFNIILIYTRALVVRPSFWFGPHVFTAYANKNPVSLFEFQADKGGKILIKFRLIDHKCKWSKTLCQIVSIMINLSMFYATKTMEQWGPNHENVTL